MATISQDNRLLAVSTPLGKDVLLLTGFSGKESLSRLFTYQLNLVSEKEDIAAKDIIGKNVTWCVARPGEEPRFFNGVVSRFASGGKGLHQLRGYRAEVVPWLWMLTRTANCRIFQQMSVPDIIKTMFDEMGFNDYDLVLSQPHPVRDYCVQYRETTFNFVSRLMEDEGIFYYFRHENAKHTLVLRDRVSGYEDCVEKSVPFSAGGMAKNHINAWEHQYEFRPGKWTQTDYNFETPSTPLLTTTQTVVKLPDAPKFEIFDYPGEYLVKPDGEARTKLRMEEEEVAHDVVSGASGCPTFTPGGKFTLEQHEVEAEAGKEYVITAIQHSAVDTSFDTDQGRADYSNSFTCIPAAVVFRAPRVTPKPVVQGAQTAVVVGPPGEEIYTDKYSRIKVQFHWDREGNYDENSSCWIRVSTIWAGKGYGIINIPRIGQEVIVDFLEGDIDRPLVIGSVYNAEQMPPTGLPKSKMVGGLRSNSTPGGGGYNGLIMDDTKGKEKITLHGQYDMDTTIEHDDSQHVVNNRSISVDGTHTETIKKDTKITVSEGNFSHDVAKGTATYHVKSDVSESFEAKLTTIVTDAVSETYNATQSTTVKKKLLIQSTEADIEINGKTEIKLISGLSSIVLKADGTIQISGKDISIAGTDKTVTGVGNQNVTCDKAQVATSGAAINSSATGKHEITGAVVKIN
ncbi:MAG: type VI secretion system tip protein VgrG [Planctomycetia bacterium]|nr:type VI secretion system tip protein VgrG [Planctomycetia bacterium]